MSAIQILPKIIRKQSLMSHRTTGRELRADRQEIKKAGAKPHRPFQHRSSHQCQYIRGQKQISDFGSRERSLGALTINADGLKIVEHSVPPAIRSGPEIIAVERLTPRNRHP
ncbi:hypothetical protein ACC808_00965 [Rhizobium ruizarguesonis]|jgi:hypothetical protein